jgi:uncharacterized membrane protein
MRLLKSTSFFFTLMLVILAAVYWFHYAPNLPNKIPTHFDGHGSADSWSSPTDFALLFWEVILGLFFFFAGLAVALQYIPGRLINLPRRNYWLGEKRGRKTRLELGETLLSFCSVTLIFFLLVFHMQVRAAIQESERLTGEFNWVLGGYLAFVGIWTGSILWRYSRAPGAE